MTDRRTNVLRSILAMSAVASGIPIGFGFGVPMPRLTEEELLSMRYGFSVEGVRATLLRFGHERGRLVLEKLKKAGIGPTDEVLRLIEPPAPAQLQIAALPALKRERYEKRPLAERKERRRKRKQRRGGR
jgi:hypothetical protein